MQAPPGVKGWKIGKDRRSRVFAGCPDLRMLEWGWLRFLKE
jgi:hypothetical protein